MYRDGSTGPAMMKRFYVNSITRDTEYDLTKGNKSSKILYFSANPNGEREIVTVALRPRPHLKRLKFDVDLGELLIKGRKSVGNRVTKELVQKVILKETGGSTLAARKIWYDGIVGRLNDEERGQFLGEFKGDDKLLSLYADGSYKLGGFDLSTRFDEDIIHLEKWVPGRAISAVYYDGQKELHYVKRFECEVNNKKRILFISETEGSTLDVVSTAFKPEIKIIYNKHLKATKNLPDTIIDLSTFIDVKGMKAQGNQLTKLKVKEVMLNHPIGKGALPWPDVEDVKLAPVQDVLEENVVTLDKSVDAESDVVEKSADIKPKKIKVKTTSVKEKKKEKPKETKKIKPSLENKTQTTESDNKDESPKTIEWDLSDDKDDENDQMTLF